MRYITLVCGSVCVLTYTYKAGRVNVDQLEEVSDWMMDISPLFSDPVINHLFYVISLYRNIYSLYPQINIYQQLHILKVLSKCSFDHLQGRFSEELPLSSISNKLSRGRFCLFFPVFKLRFLIIFLFLNSQNLHLAHS